MRKKLFKFFKSYWLSIWLIASLVVFVSVSSYAAYMRTQNVKRVVSTMGGAGNRFSSNRMDELETDLSAFKFRLIPVPGDVPVEGIDRSLTICNYPQGVETSYYGFTIYYSLEVELTDNLSNIPVFENEALSLTQYYIEESDGTKHYFVKHAETGKYTLSISGQELKGNKTSDVTYMLHFPNVDTGIYMRTFARPTVDNGGSTRIKPDDLRSLGAMISPVSVEPSQDTNWSGSLVEPRSSGKTVSDYDAFNYVVSGSGAGTITVKWKADMLEINPYYGDIEDITETITGPDTDGYKTLSFDVTASQVKNRYSFQMYKVSGSDWSEITTFSLIANDDNENSPLIVFNFEAESETPDSGD